MVLEDQEVLEPRVLQQVLQAVAVGPQDLHQLFPGQVGGAYLVVRGLHHHLVGADAGHAVVDPHGRPAQITLDLEQIVRVTVPGHLRVDGNLPDGLQILEERVSPESVEVIGPASTVKDLQAVQTEPLDGADAAPGAVERELVLPEISEYVSLSVERVAVHVEVAEIQVEREFSGVPVTVRNTDQRATVEPAAIRVRVKGPKRAVESLELAAVQVYIDAADAAPGWSKRTPSVDLPPGVELVSQKPSQVRLRLSKGRTR